jgi:hypothetical protein
VVLSGPISGAPSIASSSARRVRARLTRLLMVPTALPQICAASYRSIRRADQDRPRVDRGKLRQRDAEPRTPCGSAGPAAI